MALRKVFGIAEWCGDVVDCTIGPKDVVGNLKTCGQRGCICDRCKHNGHRCNGPACMRAEEPVECEDFNLLFCLGGCVKRSSKLELTLKKKSAVPITFQIEADIESFDQGQIVVPINAYDISAGWWRAHIRVVFSDGKSRLIPGVKFRVGPCPTDYLAPEACEPCEC